jgi:hypothetical protein
MLLAGAVQAAVQFHSRFCSRNHSRLVSLRASLDRPSSAHVFGRSLNRSDNAVHGYGIFKARRCAGTLAQVVCHPPIGASNIPRYRVFRPVSTVGCRDFQGLERRFVPARSFEGKRHELSVAEGS